MLPFYQAITDFIFVEDAPAKADIIFLPGGSYSEGAVRAASLYREGYAPYVLPSGRYSVTRGFFPMTEEEMADAGHWLSRAERLLIPSALYQTEYEYLRGILLAGGVPDTAILREDRAEYTYQNAIYSRERLEELGYPVKRAILCCKAFHARRSLLYYQEQFPETEFSVCPVVTRGISKESWMDSEEGIDTVLGELERCGKQFHQILRAHMPLGAC